MDAVNRQERPLKSVVDLEVMAHHVHYMNIIHSVVSRTERQRESLGHLDLETLVSQEFLSFPLLASLFPSFSFSSFLPVSLRKALFLRLTENANDTYFKFS